ncbi:MAG: protein kinase [Spiroplasmataceae bacterium]|nr:protein kinase [Spiroplasmataceae bacterium]
MKKNESKSTTSRINNWGTINNNDNSNNNFGSEVNYYQSSNQQSSFSQNRDNSKVISNNLSLNQLIGQGGFGKVYLGYYNNQQVAVKELPFHIKGIDKEINLLKSLRHSNIIGYYDEFQKDNNVYLVMEYAEQGSLADFIKSNKNKDHDWNLNRKFINDTIKGLKYLHNEGIIHRDLKSLNVLLSSDHTAKLADFGLAKIIDESTSTGQNPKGTWRWLAPEVLGGAKHTYQSDIYSLGIVIWEIVAQNTLPFSQFDNNFTVMYNVINDNLRETIPTDTPNDLKEIITKCWEKETNQRIPLVEIENKLNNSEKVVEVLEIKETSNLTQTSSSSSQEKLESQIKDKKDDLKLAISSLKSKLRSKGNNPITNKQKQQEREDKLTKIFDDLPNTSSQFTNYLEVIKIGLSKAVTQEEINQLYRIKKELTELEQQLNNLQTQEARIQIPPK